MDTLFQALEQGAVVVDASTRGRVQVTGADARAFLHRMSTQHVSDPTPGQGKLNTLLTDKGRLKDVVIHLDRGALGVLLIGSPGRGPDIVAWLDRYLFSEKVELVDLSAQGSAATTAGVGASALVDKLVAGAGALAPWGFIDSGDLLVAREFDVASDSGLKKSFVVVDFAQPGIAARLGGTVVDSVDGARVRAGAPGLCEITDAFTPLDLGLHDAIHWAKGCYIGQEVIARLDTYQKQSKRLVVVDAAAAPGARIEHNGAAIGTVTSAAGCHSLAVVKLPEDGVVRVHDGERVVDALAHAPPTAQSRHD
ncbi:MAG TPA: hypothetical protein VGO62_09230 [Myxococcota bacterium]